MRESNVKANPQSTKSENKNYIHQKPSNLVSCLKLTQPKLKAALSSKNV